MKMNYESQKLSTRMEYKLNYSFFGVELLKFDSVSLGFYQSWKFKATQML